MKKILILTLGLVMVFGLIGCSNKPDKLTPPETIEDEVEEKEIELTVDDKYKNDTVVKLSASSNYINVYMPTNLREHPEAVILYPYVESGEDVVEITAKDYSRVDEDTIDAVMVLLDNDDNIYYYFADGTYSDDLLVTVNPTGDIEDFEYKGLTVNYTLMEDAMNSCYIIFDISEENSGLLIIESPNEINEDKIKTYIDRIETRPAN